MAECFAFLCGRAHAPGDRVGIFSENNPFSVATYLGIIRADLVAVPFQTEMSEASFTKIVADAGIRRIFVSKRLASASRPWAEKAGVECVEESADYRGRRTEVRRQKATDKSPGTQVGGQRLAFIPQPSTLEEQTTLHAPLPSLHASVSTPLATLLFTSGPPAVAKGVMITHRNIECNTRDIVSYMGLTDADRVMVVLPFSLLLRFVSAPYAFVGGRVGGA